MEKLRCDATTDGEMVKLRNIITLKWCCGAIINGEMVKKICEVNL